MDDLIYTPIKIKVLSIKSSLVTLRYNDRNNLRCYLRI